MSYSIIIPCYAVEGIIKKLFQSLDTLNLKKTEIEFIFIDDCSCDSTYSLISDYIKDRSNFHLFKTNVNSGPGIARNLGIKYARNKYLIFLDADDRLSVDSFQILSECIRKNNNLDLIAYNFQECGNKNQNNIRSDLNVIGSDYIENLKSFLRSHIDHSSIFYVFKRDFLIRNSIQFRSGFHEDVDFMFKVFTYARNIQKINNIIYFKNSVSGSIVNTISNKHIEGYLGAYNEILLNIDKNNLLDELHLDFHTSVLNCISSRIVRILNADIKKLNSRIEIFDELKKFLLLVPDNISEVITQNRFSTKYIKIFKIFNTYCGNKISFDQFESNLNLIVEKTWSCYDIHNSIYLAPNQIRTCCKRYHHNDKLMGDAVLINDPDESISFANILDAKNDLLLNINRGNEGQCEGCPFLRFDKWGPPLKDGVKYLSIEHHSICNMKCTYCDDTYYGGVKSNYEPFKLIDSISSQKNLSHLDYVVWGGGEPLIDKNFNKTLELIGSLAPGVRQRVITNATIFSPTLAHEMESDRAFMVTSIDAGTQKTFNNIRKYKNFDRVIKNLKEYASCNAKNVIIKYILMDENSSINEIDSYVEIIKGNNLTNCNFQVSCDFKSASQTLEELCQMAYLYTSLLKIGVRFVFLDDLAWQRLPNIDLTLFREVKNFLSNFGLDQYLYQPNEMTPAYVWGTGAQSTLLLNKTYVFKQISIDNFLDPRKDIIGSVFSGVEVLSPEDELVQYQNPLIISAVQSAPFIYTDANNLGFSNIIKLLII